MARLRAPAPESAALPESRPLAGLRIAVSIDQDHPHAPFAKLLAELLRKEDVSEVQNFEAAAPPDADLVIRGHVVCNGYSEIYFAAELTCSTPIEPICTTIERPPHGDRPSNLALDAVTRLKAELVRRVDRDERRRAIRELD